MSQSSAPHGTTCAQLNIALLALDKARHTQDEALDALNKTLNAQNEAVKARNDDDAMRDEALLLVQVSNQVLQNHEARANAQKARDEALLQYHGYIQVLENINKQLKALAKNTSLTNQAYYTKAMQLLDARTDAHNARIDADVLVEKYSTILTIFDREFNKLMKSPQAVG